LDLAPGSKDATSSTSGPVSGSWRIGSAIAASRLSVAYRCGGCFVGDIYIWTAAYPYINRFVEEMKEEVEAGCSREFLVCTRENLKVADFATQLPQS
jgi:hypothetical protein